MTIGRIPSVEGGIQPTIVDAKGDLIAGVAADSINRLAVGSNDQVLVADSSTSTGLAWKSYGAQVVAGKNFLINGNFDIWQRGTSFTSVGTYTADRWISNSGEAQTQSRQSSGAPNGSQYYWRSTANQNGCFFVPTQLVETANTAALWGRTVTFSVLLRRNSTMTSNVDVEIRKSSTVDAGPGSSWSLIGGINVSNSLIPTGSTSSDWYRASLTVNIPNDGTANTLWARVVSGSSANNSVLEVAQAQLEVGSVATPFSRAAGTLQGELAACQRYYWRTGGDNTIQGVNANVIGANSTTAFGLVYNPVTMRTAPTSIDFSLLWLGDAAASFNVTGFTFASGGAGRNSSLVQINAASGLVQYRPYYVITQGTTAGFLGFSAEL